MSAIPVLFLFGFFLLDCANRLNVLTLFNKQSIGDFFSPVDPNQCYEKSNLAHWFSYFLSKRTSAVNPFSKIYHNQTTLAFDHLTVARAIFNIQLLAVATYFKCLWLE